MRKDVKLGFAIGGVLLAVLIVYVLVVPGGKDKRLSSATGGDGSSQTSGGAVTLEPVVPAAAPSTTEAGGSSAVAQVPQPPPAPPTTFDPASSGGTDPFEQPKDEAVAKADGKSRDLDWSKLLNDSQVLMVTPAKPDAAAPTTPASSEQKSLDSSAVASNVPDITKPGPTPITPPDPAPAPAEPAEPATTDDVADATPQDPPAAAPSDEVHGPPAPTVADSTNTSEAPAAAVEEKVHVVQAGESFSTISASEYGNPNLYPAIMRANPGVEPTKLRPGMKIVIPPLASATSVNPDTAQVSAAKVESPIDPQTQYRVQSGDSLYSIAKKLYGRGDRAGKLYEANRQAIGEDMNTLKVGQILTLPEPPTKLAASR